jgi:uncharacterized protein YoxC
MIIANSAELDILGVLGLILAVGTVVIPLLIFAIKALVHKTVSPLRAELDNMVGKMTVVESNYVALLEEIRKLPDAIDAKIKAREEIVTMKIDHLKEDLDKKQDK